MNYAELLRRLALHRDLCAAYGDVRNQPTEAELWAASKDSVERLDAAAAAIRSLQAELDTAKSAARLTVAQVDAHVMERLAKAEAELARWNDPESAKRQALQEEIIFALGEGQRSEVELREAQLEQTKAALTLARAQLAALAPRAEALERIETAARSLVLLYDAKWTHGRLPAVSRLRDPEAGGEVWGDLLIALDAGASPGGVSRKRDPLELLQDWLGSSDLFVAKMSQEQGNAEPPAGWIVQLERDALCGETDVLATERGRDLASAIRAAVERAGKNT